VNWVVIDLSVLILQTLSQKSGLGEFFRVVTGFQLLAKRRVIFNTLLNQLINTKIEHIVFDGRITSRCINLKTLFVVHNYNLSWVHISKCIYCWLEWQICLHIFHLKRFKVLCH